MARKNLLGSLMEPGPAKPASARARVSKPGQGTAPIPAKAKGAVGAVSQSIADLKARAIAEIDPNLIDAGGLTDRLDHDAADHAALMESIRDYGQQVPVLVRPHPETAGRYQIVYGRRRVLALRDLGLSVKAMIRTMDDESLILAQGQENSARRDLSFIEKANFARQMRDAGYKRKIICDALTIDKTAISRMLSIADKIAPEVLAVIGTAPGIGRDRWAVFADLAEVDGLSGKEAMALAQGETSDARFESLMHYLTLPARRAREDAAIAAAVSLRPKPRRLTAEDGTPLGRARWAKDKVTLVLEESAGAQGFGDWLVGQMEELHRRWQKSEKE